MKQLKFLIAAAAALGVIAIFAVPYVSLGDGSMKYWDLHTMPKGWTGLLNGPRQVYVAILGFAVPLGLAVLAIAGQRLARWHAITALVFSLIAFAPEGVRKGLSVSLGGKLLFVAAVAGIVLAIAGVVRPERAAVSA